MYGGESRPTLRESRRRHRCLRIAAPVLTSMILLLGATLAPGEAGASSPADQGVTATTINVGVPVIDFAALASVGVKLNEGNIPDAYSAIVANMNAHGGVDGRKIVMSYVYANPAVPASGDAACTKLTEDDKIFVAIAPVYPDCYQVQHDTPVIAGALPADVPASAAPDFNLIPPDIAYDPVVLAAFDKRGVFKGKKVGVYAGSGIDAAEANAVTADLKKLHVDVVQTAIVGAPATDTVAVDQETQSDALRFQSEGVNEVVGVGGSGATDWPRALKDTQSTYKPPWIATNVTDISSNVESAKGGNPYLYNVMTASPITSVYGEWESPAVQKCAALVRKAYPSDKFTPPPKGNAASGDSSDETYAPVLGACQELAMFAKIADAAGKHLTVASFTKAGEGLRNVTFPGTGSVSFGPGRPYTVGTASILIYDSKTGTLVPASPAKG
jgi:hypothetical protein